MKLRTANAHASPATEPETGAGQRVRALLRQLVSCLAATILLVPFLAGEGNGTVPPDGPLILGGSTSQMDILKVLLESFQRKHPEIRVEQPVSLGSTGGIKAAADGAVSLGLSSRPLRENEKGLGLTLFPYARAAVVIGAHKTVVDTDLSFADLVEIFKGKKSRWKDGREIIVLCREQGNSSQEVMEHQIPGFKEALADSYKGNLWTCLYSAKEMAEVLVKTPYAMGITDMGVITTRKLPVKPLRINGVQPNAANVRNGKYPLIKTLYLVFKKERLSPEAKVLLGFIKSPEGRRLLKANGYQAGE